MAPGTIHPHYLQQCQSVVEQVVNCYEHSSTGKLTAVFGPCYSGKTVTAIWLARALSQMGLNVRVAQPRVNRPTDVFDGYIESRDGEIYPAISYFDSDSIKGVFDGADATIFNEIQFSPENLENTLFEEIESSLKAGKFIVSAGLFYSSLLTIFPISKRIADMADQTFELRAICESCGQPNAVYCQRLVNGKPARMDDALFQAVAANVRYVPRCKACHKFSKD